MLDAMFLLMIALVGQTGDDPLAPARRGMLQCYVPSVAERTCSSMARYVETSDGKWMNYATVGLWEGLVVETQTPSTVENDGICTVVTADYVETARFTRDGKPLAKKDDDAARAELRAMFIDLYGVKICVTYHVEGDLFVSESNIGGVPQPNSNMEFRWVDPKDGYRVVPS